ncbi:MAG: hypothetical protein AMXMBFR56_43700 [Polyangiaceae bacterium]
MPSLPRAALTALAFSLALACGDDESASGPHDEDAAVAGGGAGGGAGTAPVACELGTMYPELTVIDPDAPQYSDASWTQADVATLFAKAKTDGSMAYLAYRAARDHSHLLDCAFCSCGCAPGIGHLSAIDCFKDMHGFA